MTVSDSFRTYVLEQLGRTIQRIRGRSMFSGVGVYAGEHFFALIDDDVLYFKVDDSTRPDFIAHGMRPWSPFEDGRESRGYYQLPAELLEDPDELKLWVDKAVLVASRKKLKRPKAAPRAKAKMKAAPKAKPKGRRRKR